MQSILEAIGNTPLVRLHPCAPANGAELWLKLEYRNPTGSMKDRMALAMIEGAERDGLISKGDTVVEYTGGSTGPALALVCRAKGYRALIVIADCFTEERMQLMRALGAELDVIPSVEGPPKVTAQDIANMVTRAAELAARPGHYATDQFNNPYAIPDHRDRLGREIWEQTEGRVTGFCHGVGTAGSLMGVSEALKPRGVFIQAHEPAGSSAISGGDRGPFLIQGWTGGVHAALVSREGRSDRDDRRSGSIDDDPSPRPRGRHLRGHLDRRERRRRTPARRPPRTGGGHRHPSRRHGLQVHERRSVRCGATGRLQESLRVAPDWVKRRRRG
jgi:cysteine synthase A